MALSVGLREIENARAVLSQGTAGVQVRRTAVLEGCETATGAPARLQEHGVKLSLKLENTQALGCFKTRGMVYKMHQLLSCESTPPKELVSMSAGNFGRTMAHLCKAHDIPAVLFMPETVPSERLTYIRDQCGATTVLAPGIELATRVQAYCAQNPDAHFAHPFDDEALFAGYGSIGLEVLEQVPDVDVIVVPVGGGGLLAGVAAAVKLTLADNPHRKAVRVVGVEPEGAASMHESVKQKKQHHLKGISTFVNGLAPPFAGEKALQYVLQYVDECVLVSDDEILHAMKLLFNQFKVVAESAAAAPLAALVHGKIQDIDGKNIVCIVSGGNIDVQEMMQRIG